MIPISLLRLNLIALYFSKNRFYDSIFNRNKIKVAVAFKRLTINNDILSASNITAEIKESCTCKTRTTALYK